MAERKVSNKNFKAVCSVTYLCKDLELSRAQFYNLQNQGIFPKALKDERTGRPYFDIELQRICHRIRSTGIGYDSRPYLFYSPRTHPGKPCSKRNNHVDSKHKDFASALNQMGLDITADQVSKALKILQPDGVSNANDGVVIRELFRFLK